MTLPSKNILVTGGAGYIGSACVHQLIKHGHKVTVVDNCSTGQPEKVSTEANIILSDITDQTALENVFKQEAFDAVLHFAALKSVEESESDPSRYFYNNVLGTVNLLRMMDHYKVGEIIFSSTAAVYAPDVHGKPYTEESAVMPVNVYGSTKESVEKIIATFLRTGAIKKAINFRYFNVAGDAGLRYKERAAKNIFPVLASVVATGSPFKVFGFDYPTTDGTCIRDYVHVSDLVSAHMLALESNQSGVYNLGTSQGYSVNDLVCAFEQHSGKKVNVVKEARRAGDSAISLADATKAANILRWKPQKSLQDMVEGALDVYGG